MSIQIGKMRLVRPTNLHSNLAQRVHLVDDNDVSLLDRLEAIEGRLAQLESPKKTRRKPTEGDEGSDVKTDSENPPAE